MNDDEIDFNEPIPSEPKICVHCGKTTETVSCVVESFLDEPDYECGEHCYDCCLEEGFCYGCGLASAGQNEYEFGKIKGYCGNCQEQIRSNVASDDDDYDYDEWEDSPLYGTP